jgi:hypothetical protein
MCLLGAQGDVSISQMYDEYGLPVRQWTSGKGRNSQMRASAKFLLEGGWYAL